VENVRDITQGKGIDDREKREQRVGPGNGGARTGKQENREGWEGDNPRAPGATLKRCSCTDTPRPIKLSFIQKCCYVTHSN
jgi:hypothetical protein